MSRRNDLAMHQIITVLEYQCYKTRMLTIEQIFTINCNKNVCLKVKNDHWMNGNVSWKMANVSLIDLNLHSNLWSTTSQTSPVTLYVVPWTKHS